MISPSKKSENGLPISPLILAQQETMQQLQIARQKLEWLKSMDNHLFDSSLHYLANLRKFDENTRMLSGRKEMLDQKAMKASLMTVVNLDPMEFSIQLTLIEFEYLRRIDMGELATNVWKGLDAPLYAPNVTGLIRFARHIYEWTQTEILTTADAKMRSIIVSHFIRIAKACHMTKNFDISSIIIRALQSPAIKRLQQTWKEVHKTVVAVADELSELFSSRSDYEAIRKLIYRTDPPFMPLFELLLKDLDFVSTSMDYASNNEHSNLSVRHPNEIFNVIEYLQNHMGEYQHKPDLMLQHYILTKLGRPESEFMALSYVCEAKKTNESSYYEANVNLNRITEPFPNVLSSTAKQVISGTLFTPTSTSSTTIEPFISPTSPEDLST